MQTTRSTDGTTIAFDRIGQGSAIILITGALNYSKFGVVGDLVPLLSSDFTVINYDRRGRGASGNNLPYSVDKEIDDIDALIDVVGGSAYLYGHSAGAALALYTAAALGERVKAVAAYEPPMSKNWRTDQPAKLAISHSKRMLDEGQNLEMITLFMRFIGMSNELIDETLASEHRGVLIAMAPTLIYETEIMLRSRHFVRQQAKHVSQPALLLAGDKSSKAVLGILSTFSSALPDSQTIVIPDQTHTVEAIALAPVLREFFNQS